MLHIAKLSNGSASWFALLALILAPPVVFGQASFEAQVRGVVQDTTGSVIVGARVTMTDVATNIATVTATDERGYYIFVGLRPATYNLKAEMPGFRAEEMKDVVLTISQRTTLDFTLNVAGLETTMTVVEAAPTLDTGGSAIGTTVTGLYTRDIPLYGRSYFPLVFLSGGVTEAAGSGASDNYPSGTNFVSNGQRNATAEVRFDGAPTSAPEEGEGGNSNVYYTPSVEVIQEFKVENNSFSAEYGNNGGTVINIMMKQGGNQFHGSAWWFGQRSAMDANDFFSNAAALPKPDHTHDQYGFMVSGPIKKQKTFFLFDFEKLRDLSPSRIGATVPTDLQRNGDFSQTYTYDDNGSLTPITIYDPRTIAPDGTRQPFSGNKIPTSMIDPIAKNVVGYFPEPNLAGDPFTQYNNFRRNVTSTFTGYQFDGRVDHQFNDNNRLGVRYSRAHNISTRPPVLVDDGFVYKTDVHNALVDYNRTISPRMLYNGRIGLDLVHAPGYTQYPDLAKAGFPSILASGGLKRMPAFEFEGPYTPLFDECCVDTNFAHNLLTYSSALSWVKGEHSLKFGGEQRVFFNDFWQPDMPTGVFTFGPDVTTQQPFNGVVTEGDSFAGLLLGYGTSGAMRLKPAVADKSKETGFYIQDDWKVSPKLTLNLGLRYEWSTPYTERYNRSQFADFAANTGVAVPGFGEIRGTSIFSTSGRRNIPVDRNNFAPRLGVAYSWDSKTVIRAGAGIYYGMNIATNFQYSGPAFYKDAPILFTKDAYQTQYASFENPFPAGLPEPQGRKYGPLAMWGFSNSSDLSYQKARNAEIYQWSLGIQRLLPGDLVIGVDYSANRSTHLPWGSWGATRNRNFISTDTRKNFTSAQLESLVPNPFQALFSGPSAIFNEPDSVYNDPEIPLLNLLRPYPQFDGEFTGLPLLAANSNYNSMQLRFEKRSGKYFTIQGSYTLARATDDNSAGSNSWVGWLADGNPQALDRLNLEQAISANNATHRLAAAFTFQVPVGRGLLLGNNMHRVADAFLGGWSVSSGVTLQSGQPVTVTMSRARLADGLQRPNVTCSDAGAGISYHNAAATGARVFKAACFEDPGDQQIGDSPRYFESLHSPGINNVDIGLRKQFVPRENMKVQVRVEAFNAFNRTRFDRANFFWGSGGFGEVTGLGPGFSPRRMQIVARFEF
jgi:hypothetical protein